MATSKPQNLLVPLIVSVVITVATSVTAFLFYQNWAKAQTELTSAKDAKTKADTAKAAADLNIKLLKEKIGYPDAEFGTAQDAPGGTSLMSKIAEELTTKYVDPNTPASFSFKDELFRLASKHENTAKELAVKTDKYNELMAEFVTKRKVEADKIDVHDKNFLDAEKTRQDIQTEQERSLDERDRQINLRHEQATTLAEQKKQKENELERLQTRSDIEKNQLVLKVKGFRESMQKIQSSGTPVGSVVSVDNLNDEVYIDRGEADLLPRQTTFSIWAADKRGTLHWREKNEKAKNDAKREFDESGRKNILEPRLEGGPKAYIEILEILGPHQAKGRITMEQTLNPITPGDLLFSPIWAPGQRTHFALAGRFDMTGKDTDDRVLLINLIKRQGGVIDAEVKNDGTLEGNIEVGTNYLVIGKMPGDSDESTDEEKKHAGRVHTTIDNLMKEAKDLGIEILDQNKFYDFMGYKPHSNKYDPGGYTGAPEPKHRFDNPANSTRPTGVQSFESGASSRPTGTPGASKGTKK